MSIVAKRITDPKHFILYHGGGCTDGLAAAYAGWRKFREQSEAYPVKYGEALPDMPLTADSEIYVVDFSLNLKTLMALSQHCKKVQVIDHHQSAYDDFIYDAIVQYTYYAHPLYQASCRYLMKHCKAYYAHVCETLGICPPIFDMTKSGAYLTWEYFHPDLPVPEIIQYVSDRDLWQFKHEQTRAALEGVYFSGLKDNMAYWHRLVNDKHLLEECIEKGRSILKYRQTLIDGYKTGDRLRILAIDNLTVAIYNTSDFIDEIAEMLYTHPYLNIDYTLSYYIRQDGTAKISFRTQQYSIHPLLKKLGFTRGIDLVPIAKAWNGGGHRTSAGASLSYEQTLILLDLLNKK